MNVIPELLQKKRVDPNYITRISTNMNDPLWDDFVAHTSNGQIVQTTLFGQLKSTLGYETKRIIINENEKIIAGGQIFIKKIFPFISVGLMPKGPLYKNWDPFLGNIFLKELKAIIHKNKLSFLSMQPAIENEEFEKMFTDQGFKPSWLELASGATIILDLSDEADHLLAKMKRQTRQNIRRSVREEITCREGDESDLAFFYNLHQSSSERQGFTPYSEEYFKKMYQYLAPNNYLKLIISEYNNEPVSALLLLLFNDTVIAKYLGWSGLHSERRPNDAVFWASILWAKSHNYKFFDFEGIGRKLATKIINGIEVDNRMDDSYSLIKLGYGGQVILFPQAYDYIENPLLRWAYQKIFSNPKRASDIFASLDRIRRQFG